jgi:hypothetical protein
LAVVFNSAQGCEHHGGHHGSHRRHLQQHRGPESDTPFLSMLWALRQQVHADTTAPAQGNVPAGSSNQAGGNSMQAPSSFANSIVLQRLPGPPRYVGTLEGCSGPLRGLPAVHQEQCTALCNEVVDPDVSQGTERLFKRLSWYLAPIEACQHAF